MQIETLDDLTAQQILETIVRSRAGASASSDSLASSTGLSQALIHEFQNHEFQINEFQISEFQIAADAKPVSEGELARQALLLLAEDPDTRHAIETMAANWQSKPQKFDLAATIGITAAVLIVLQTHVKFERASTGKWSVKVEKKPTSEALLKALVQKLINYGKHEP